MTIVRHPGADTGCTRCLGLGLDVGRDGGFAVARLCGCVRTPCPACADTRFVDTEGGKLRRCDCHRVAMRQERFNATRLPGRYATATLASSTPQAAAMPAFIALNAYLQQYRPKEENRGVVLWGEVGRGKTHLLCAVLRELVLRHGIRARFVEFTHLLSDLKLSFDRGEGTADLLEPLSQVEILAIDELGKGRNTEWELTVLDDLITRRYNAGLPVLATTNYAPAPASGRSVPNLAAVDATRPSLVDRVGERIYSRLRETSHFIELLGEDLRELQRPATRAVPPPSTSPRRPPRRS